MLSVQLQSLRECCERVKSSAAALRNGLAPPLPVLPVVEENTAAKQAAASKIAAVLTSVLFGTTRLLCLFVCCESWRFHYVVQYYCRLPYLSLSFC